MQSNYCYVSHQHFFIHSGRQVDNRAKDLPPMRQRCQTNRKVRRQKKIKLTLNTNETSFQTPNPSHNLFIPRSNLSQQMKQNRQKSWRHRYGHPTKSAHKVFSLAQHFQHSPNNTRARSRESAPHLQASYASSDPTVANQKAALYGCNPVLSPMRFPPPFSSLPAHDHALREPEPTIVLTTPLQRWRLAATYT